MAADTGHNRSKLRDRCVWVFDLDNTLYPAECNLFAQIDRRMTEFVAEFLDLPQSEARKVQKGYYAQYGTTLNGLMSQHGMAPDAFLDHVHDIDLSALPQCAELAGAIEALPGRRLIYTNGSRGHADRVVSHMGLSHLFEGYFAIEDSQFLPKPNPPAYEAFCKQFEINPVNAVFFEDLDRNLKPAHTLGFATVLVQSEKDWSHEPESARPASIGDDRGEHIDYVTGDLTHFLRSLPV